MPSEQTAHLQPTVLRVNGAEHELVLDTRATLLDVLRERLDLIGAKKGCDHGQCGACTVLLDGRRANACLLLAVTLDGVDVVTVEGLADDGAPHPLQEASSSTTPTSAATARQGRSARPRPCSMRSTPAGRAPSPTTSTPTEWRSTGPRSASA